MTYMKILSGHSSAKWIRYYLFKNDRALDKDFLNLTDRDWKGRDWAKVMDRTREIFGNNVPVKKDTKVRTYEHFIISLDEKDDGVELDDFRDFVNEWASKWFDSRGPEGQGIGRFEVAIAYHDDNKARGVQGKQGILHAHLVINNTELETKRRISGLRTTKVVQAMRADLQTMSLERGWHAFATDGKSYTQAEMDEKGLKVSRGKRLDRAMSALDRVLANEAKGAQIEDFSEAMQDLLDKRHPIDKLIPETFTVGAAPSSQPKVGEGDPIASDKVSGFSYTTMRTEDGRVMRLVVPHGFGDSETMAERQIETREGWSWKDDIRDRVDVAVRISKGPADFASKLGELGIKVNYNREGDLVYHHPSDPASRKVKGSTLGKQYAATSIEQVIAEKHTSQRQRSQSLPSRERWMNDDERAAALAIAKAAIPCTREGAELMGRLKSTIEQNDSAARDEIRHGMGVEYPSSLANSLGIEYPKPSTVRDSRRKKMTEEEILEAMADIRDEKGFGGLAANNPTNSTTKSNSGQQQEEAAEIQKSKHH
ncbi:relaxase/mobilization nuclease domain-containing protein [Collinsella aerofaciens]|uniref:relaxase/mobilization nuclease domain-containing protein n=1 Tax=Collinsella aerofaciens TaxID=74426 RepID=UPI00232B9EC0|nr:relaxase/mobilization nuclease domain-containing protein [Collinsella aerofaciens]MDB1910988.1 relaxase/mobilization nuclease domain-containing protein [Collinsella aerofaciens]MDB1912892.1 relaxase/mobilization nuclease domain-containing protein [Collinsella aerofaciens]